MLNSRFAALLLLTFVYSGANGSAQVSGTVSNNSGSALAHITVALISDQSGDSLVQQTDAFGRYLFPTVTNGTYQLTFSDQNFITYVDEDPVPDEGTIYLDAVWPQTINLSDDQSLDLGDFSLSRTDSTDSRQSNAAVTNCTSYGDHQSPQTLAYAIANARNINIECSGTIPVPELTITKDVEITSSAEVAFEAAGFNRIFRVLPGVTLRVSGIDLTNGDFTDGLALQNMGTTTLENAGITGHTGNSAAVLNRGTLTLRNIRQYRNSILYDSVLTNTGVITGTDVLIESHVSSAGPVITNDGRIELRNCQISGMGTNNVWSVNNNPESTLKLFNCTLTRSSSPFSNQGTLEIYDSSIDANDGDQGVIESSGVLKIGGTSITNNDVYGGIINNEGDAVIINSTISGNSAGAGLFDDGSAGVISNSGLMRITTSTITSNTHRIAGDHQLGNSGQLTISNSIISGVAGGTECGGIAAVQSLGHNVHTDGTCGNAQQTDIPFGNPGLLALADNGGLGKTHALQPGSDAIDAGNCGNGATAKDQRGISRPQGNACDIGAYEVTASATDPEPEEQPVDDDPQNADNQSNNDNNQTNPDQPSVDQPSVDNSQQDSSNMQDSALTSANNDTGTAPDTDSNEVNAGEFTQNSGEGSGGGTAGSGFLLMLTLMLLLSSRSIIIRQSR